MSQPFAADLLDAPSSEELNQIQQEIRRDLSLRVHNFRLRAVEEGLILEGRTKTYYGKQVVQHAVMDATDFPIQSNNIVVG